jgi:hypothetical protein
MTEPQDGELSEDDYAAIEAAVMETARGRWFLAEFARRNRNTDTETVLSAIDRLEQAMTAQSGPRGGEADRLRFDLFDMASAIAQTKAEIAAIKPDGDRVALDGATNELDAIVKSTETATGEILAAAERLQEVAWVMREAGIDPAACDTIDQGATDIYTACSFQDITGQRTRKVIQVVRYLENRLGAMIAIWGGGPEMPRAVEPIVDAAASAAAPSPLDQHDVDEMLDIPPGFAPPPERPEPTETEAEPEPLALDPVALSSPFSPVERPVVRARTQPATEAAPPAPPGPQRAEPAAVTLAEIEALSFEEKAALFS